MTKNIEIEAPNGEIVEIEVEQLSTIESLRKGAELPDGLLNGGSIDIESINFMIELAKSQTILTEELMNELDQEELGKTLSKIFAATFGESRSGDSSSVNNFDNGPIGFQ